MKKVMPRRMRMHVDRQRSDGEGNESAEGGGAKMRTEALECTHVVFHGDGLALVGDCEVVGFGSDEADKLGDELLHQKLGLL